MNIYVSNLSIDVMEDELKEVFEEYGEVASVNIIKDSNTGKSRGFGFIQMVGKSKSWGCDKWVKSQRNQKPGNSGQ